MRRVFVYFVALGMIAFCGLLTGGCAHVSPAVGTWTMAAGAQTATLSLKPDGTGTVSMPPVVREQPVSWTEEKGTVTLKMGGAAQQGTGGQRAAGGPGTTLTGTLSEDAKTMSVPFGPMTLSLQKQPDSK